MTNGNDIKMRFIPIAFCEQRHEYFDIRISTDKKEYDTIDEAFFAACYFVENN